MKPVRCVFGFHSWRPLRIAPDFEAWKFYCRDLVDWHCIECGKSILKICPNWRFWNPGMPLLGYSDAEWLLSKDWRAYILLLRKNIEWDCT